MLRTVCFLLAPRGRNLSERSRVHFPPLLSPLQPPAIKRNTHSSGDVFSPFEKIIIQGFLWNYNGLRILSRLVLLSQGRVVEDALASCWIEDVRGGLLILTPVQKQTLSGAIFTPLHSLLPPSCAADCPRARFLERTKLFSPEKKRGGSRRSKLSLFFGLITPDVTSIQTKNPSSSQFQNFSALARCSRRGEGKNLLAHFLLIDEFAAMFLGGIPCPL